MENFDEAIITHPLSAFPSPNKLFAKHLGFEGKGGFAVKTESGKVALCPSNIVQMRSPNA